MKTISILLSVLAGGIPGLTAHAHEPEDADLEMVKFVEPIFPYKAELEGVFEGEISVFIDVDVDGRVTDFLPIKATNRFLLSAIEKVVYDWVFAPALREGRPVGSIRKMRINFRRDGLMVVSSTAAITSAYLNQFAGALRHIDYVIPMKDLDRIPKPIEIKEPLRYRNMPSETMQGLAVFEFFIDEEGQVRLPLLVEREGDILLAESASIALRQWRFEPPVQNGRAVVTRARQAFRFGK